MAVPAGGVAGRASGAGQGHAQGWARTGVARDGAAASTAAAQLPRRQRGEVAMRQGGMAASAGGRTRRAQWRGAGPREHGPQHAAATGGSTGGGMAAF